MEACGISKEIVRGRARLLTATRYHLSSPRLAGNLALTASKSSGSGTGLDAIVERVGDTAVAGLGNLDEAVRGSLDRLFYEVVVCGLDILCEARGKMTRVP